MSRIIAISVSPRRGTKKSPVARAELVVGYGIEGDAHGGDWHRQVSLLSAERMREVGVPSLVGKYGIYAENIATEGIDWKTIPVGTRVRLGERAEVEITQIGKECHAHCEIHKLTGDCIMPREGVFARVTSPGTIQPGDLVVLLDAENRPTTG